MRRIGRRAGLAAPLVVVGGLLGGALALQLLAGGIRDRALGPVVLAMSVALLGGLIAVHRPRLSFGPLLTVTGLGFALGSLAASALDYGTTHPIPRLAAQACFAAVSSTRLLLGAWVAFIVWFPDGRAPSRGWQRFVVAATAACGAVAALTWLLGPGDHVFDFYKGTTIPAGAGSPLAGTWPWAASASDVLLLLPLLALLSLVQRYRRGDAVVRQQVRWLLLGAGVTVTAQILGVGLLAGHSALSDAGLAFSIVMQPVPMLAATVAILRYRLWDIDLVVSRALVYAVLWAGLSALLMVPALAAGLLVGGRGAGAAVGIALLVTVVFHPARRRLEALAERVVYRHRARPYVLLSGFWETLRAADLDGIGPLVAEAVRGGLHVEWAGAWVYQATPAGPALRPLGVAGAAATGARAVSPATAERLHDARTLVLEGPPAADLDRLWPAAPAAVVPLVAADDLVGVLACGGRRGDRLRAADYELLEMLARECAMRLRNLRLEAQLRERLVEIEAQAAELARSRQRLVTAQDEERRRIERNLHDGVQQQLVSLAARLHRAAGGTPQLAALAAEAEDAVFALQELGRGIYPSVLADQGLPAALRTQAARVPVAVHLEVDEALAGRRLDREVEAALYFVALEALTNAYKHTGGTSISVWLHQDGGSVRLDVVDTGAGFRPDADGAGSGLQNMHDRIAAVGGSLTVDTGAGRGTRVTATAPMGRRLPAHPAQPVAADSRR